MNSTQTLEQRKKAAGFVEEAYLQVALIRAMAFGERSWMLIYAVLQFLDKTHNFWSVSGVAGFVLGVMFLGPVYGLLIYFISRRVYFRIKPKTLTEFNLIAWIASGLCFPVSLFVSRLMFDLYYESYESLAKLALRAIHP